MPTISNKTEKPLRVPLPRGKVLHLGPRMCAQVAAIAAQHPPLTALVTAGTIEILEDGPSAAQGGLGGKQGRMPMLGHTSASGSRRSGDR